MQRFIIRWRVWLTHRLTGDWLDGDAYYKGRFIDGPIDNADQRIQQDIDIFTTDTGPETNTPTVGTAQTLVFGTVFAIVSVVAFTPILWNLAGPLHDLRSHDPEGTVLDGTSVTCAVTTVVAFWIGRPLIRLLLPQRAHQCSVPLCAGTAPRCGRGHRPLSRRRSRTGPADDQVRGHHRQLPGLRPPRHRIPRLEQVDERDRRSAAHGHSGAPIVRWSDSVRRRHAISGRIQPIAKLLVLLPFRLRLVRQLPRGHHPPRRVDRLRTKQQGSYRH